MSSVPSTGGGFGTGTVATSDLNTKLVDPVNFLLNPPIAELRQTVAQTLTSTVFAAITFTTEDVDSANGHDNASNTSRYTAVYPGWYQVSGAVSFANNTTGLRIVHMRVNGTILNGSRSLLPATGSGVGAVIVVARTKHVFLNVGDYVELFAQQDSGGNLNTDPSAGELQPTMTVRWVSN